MIKFADPVYLGKEIRYATSALEDRWISDGPYAELFRKELKDVFGSHVVLTSNGTSALQLAYLCLGIQPGEEVIVPAYGFMAAANVAMELGIKPVFADVDPHTYLIDFKDVGKKITKKTKAIVIIHTYGRVADVGKFRVFRLPIIEDCAESIFSKYNGYWCGTIGDISTFSFHASKTLTTGEGGMLMTNNPGIFEVAQLYANHGVYQRGTYNHVVPANNFRMSNLHAAIGLGQIENYKTIISMKKEILNWFSKYGLLDNQWALDEEIPWVIPISIDYDQIEALYENNISYRSAFVPAHRLGYFGEQEFFPNAERIYQNIIVLPAHLKIKEEDVKFMKEVLYGG